MENMLEKIINQNEKKYNDFKGKLESILGTANAEYSSMLSDYNNQINLVRNDNGYSKEGKIRENERINSIFNEKLKNKAAEYNDKLITKIDEELNKREKQEAESYIDEKDENYYSKKILNEITKQHLNSNMLVQLMYVNSMLNSITEVKDADMLEYVYKYACIDKNFSDEIINMIYLKARNLFNMPVKKESNEIIAKPTSGKDMVGENEENDKATSILIAKNRTKILNICQTIEKYNHDYSSDLIDFKKRFSNQKVRGDYPGGLFMSKEYKRDFNSKIINEWGNKKINDPWGKINRK